MEVETPALDELLSAFAGLSSSIGETMDELMQLVGVCDDGRQSYMEAQQLSDRERVRKLQRQQFKKGNRFK